VAEPLRIKGSDGKTYLNPKANRDFLAGFIDKLGQFLTGETYGPDYNMYGNPIKQVALSEQGLPEVAEQEPPVPEAPVETDTEIPVVTEQMSPESQARFDETLRMMDVIKNVPLKKEPELSAEDKARKAFESKTNNPARDAGLDPNFLFARHKANLASQLAKQGVTVEEAKANPEQAFLADQLGKYLGSKREFNSGRDRGF
tara:strand:- start:14 stop:616 length:603 start_codon:yes stop_codon:yes gene_type:complete